MPANDVRIYKADRLAGEFQTKIGCHNTQGPHDPQPAKPDLAAVKDNALCRAYCMPEESYERARSP